jgi:putative DNA primase/helicase
MDMVMTFGPLPDHIIEAVRTWPRNIPRLRSADMVKCDPDIEYLVRDLLPKRGVAAVYGPSGSGKSFLAMDLAFHVASRNPSWFFMSIKSAAVVYVALEGQGGIKKRMQAWEQHNAVDLADEVQFFMDPFRLDEQSSIDELAREAVALVGKGCVVVIDTLAQSMAGYDENNSAEMGAAIAGAQRLAAQVDGLVILIHHTGKDPTKGMRGHSSLLGALDASIEVNARSSGRTWKVQKSKDGEAGQEYDFELISYTVGTDADGRPITSCAVRQTIHPPSAKLPPVVGKHRISVMSRLMSLMPNGAGVMDIDAAVVAVTPEIDCEPRRRGSVARATINALVVSGHLVRDGDKICLPA